MRGPNGYDSNGKGGDKKGKMSSKDANGKFRTAELAANLGEQVALRSSPIKFVCVFICFLFAFYLFLFVYLFDLFFIFYLFFIDLYL